MHAAGGPSARLAGHPGGDAARLFADGPGRAHGQWAQLRAFFLLALPFHSKSISSIDEASKHLDRTSSPQLGCHRLTNIIKFKSPIKNTTRWFYNHLTLDKIT